VPGLRSARGLGSPRASPQGPATIVHGDYGLDNMILTLGGEVATVVDWELCTLADVGLLMVRPRPRRARLLRRPRLLEAGDHPRGRLRPLRRRPVRQVNQGIEGFACLVERLARVADEASQGKGPA
jgi:hypothetical protein